MFTLGQLDPQYSPTSFVRVPDGYLGQLFRVYGGGSLTEGRIIAAHGENGLGVLAKRGVVLLGESHDEAEHYRWQHHTIAALVSRRPDMVLGFEMFPRRVQAVLDRWSKGELNEADFLQEVDWTEIWSTDAEFYLPLFHFALHRLPMLALNVDRTISQRIA